MTLFLCASIFYLVLALLTSLLDWQQRDRFEPNLETRMLLKLAILTRVCLLVWAIALLFLS